MKKIVSVVALIIVLVAAMPFASGLLLEKYVRSAFEDLNMLYTETGTGYALEIVSYERGYLTSDIEWNIDLGKLKSLYPIDEVVFVDHAEHGFAGIASTTSLEKNAWFSGFVKEKLGGRNPLQISTTCSYLGNIETTVALDPFSATFEEEPIDVGPMRMVVKTDYQLRHFESTAEWQGLSAGEKMEIGPASMGSNLKMQSAFLWDGDVTFALAHLKVREKESPIELKGLKGNYVIDVQDDQSQMSGEAIFSIDGLAAPKMKIDNARVRFAAAGMNVKGYEAFIRMYSRTMSGFLEEMAVLDSASEDNEAMRKQKMAAMGLQMVSAYEKLMKAGLELKISDLEVKMADGDITGDITLRLLRDITFMQFLPMAAQPEQLLDVFYLKSDCRLPISLIGENPKLLTPAYPGMQTGLFVKNGDHLVHQAETIDGKLMVNGRAVVLARQEHTNRFY